MSPLPARMHILEFEAPHRAVWKEVDLPAPARDEVLVKILGVATCPQWDLHMIEGRPMFPGAPLDYPLVPGQPGHEAMGEVVSVGTDVRTFSPGMHVAAWRDPGNRRMGCYAQYVPLTVRRSDRRSRDRYGPKRSLPSSWQCVCRDRSTGCANAGALRGREWRLADSVRRDWLPCSSPGPWGQDGDRTGSSRAAAGLAENSARMKSGIPENTVGPPDATTRMHSIPRWIQPDSRFRLKR